MTRRKWLATVWNRYGTVAQGEVTARTARGAIKEAQKHFATLRPKADLRFFNFEVTAC